MRLEEAPLLRRKRCLPNRIDGPRPGGGHVVPCRGRADQWENLPARDQPTQRKHDGWDERERKEDDKQPAAKPDTLHTSSVRDALRVGFAQTYWPATAPTTRDHLR